MLTPEISIDAEINLSDITQSVIQFEVIPNLLAP
jgi:hypothetical protein